MKFAFLLYKYFPFGGMQRDMLRTATRLAESGHDIDIYTISWDGDYPTSSRIKVHLVPTSGWLNHQKYKSYELQIHSLLGDKSSYDLVVGYNRMSGLDVYFAADPCFIQRAHYQRNWLYRLTPRYRWFQKIEEHIFSAQSPVEVLMVDMGEREIYQDWYGTQEGRFHYIPPYLSRERLQLHDKAEMRQYLREQFDLSEDAIVLLLVGSGFYVKGLDRAVESLKSLPLKLLKRVYLVAVGQDKPAPFIKMAKRLGVAKNVIISSGRSDIPKLMQGADLYLHPAYRENTGLVLLEALAAGLPVLSTASCGYAVHVQRAEAGKIVPMPFSQDVLDGMLLDMLNEICEGSTQMRQWQEAGIKYADALMKQNDGDAEAQIILDIAERKKFHT